MLNLRPYQSDCVEAVEADFEVGVKKSLVVVPTGGGKTVIFSHLASRVPGRTLILAHREELIDQAIRKLHSATGIYAQKEKADSRASLSAKVVVGSIQTLARRAERWPSSHFNLIIVDEAHHAISKTYQSVLGRFDSHANVLGVTATPDRGDRKNLGSYFEKVSFEVSLTELIKGGYLSPIIAKSVPLEISLKGVASKAGDFAEADVDRAIDPYLAAIAREIKNHAAFRKTLVFLPLIATSKKFAAICQGVGLDARHIDGGSEDRRERLGTFESGHFDVLCNAMLLTEGYDDPGIDCVVILRPTRSRGLYSQMVGRGTRIHPAKKNLLLLDFLWLHEQHKLIRPAHLIAEDDEVAEEAASVLAAGGGQREMDLEGLVGVATAQRERKLREELEAKQKRKAREINPVEFCQRTGYEFANGRNADVRDVLPVTETHKKLLERYGFDPKAVSNAGEAERLMRALSERSARGLATPKQVALCRRLGHPDPFSISRDTASRYITARIKR